MKLAYNKRKVEKRIWDLKMKGNNKIVLLAINFLANEETGQCTPTVERLVDITGLGESSIHLYLKKLEQENFIVKKERRDDSGYQISNLYRINVLVE